MEQGGGGLTGGQHQRQAGGDHGAVRTSSLWKRQTGSVAKAARIIPGPEGRGTVPPRLL